MEAAAGTRRAGARRAAAWRRSEGPSVRAGPRWAAVRLGKHHSVLRRNPVHEASTDPPADADRFTALPAGDFELFVRAAGPNGLPGELHVDLTGLRRRRVRAYWNGCAYLA